MYLYGKLYLTHNGISLDETRSLLQKSLRRKEKELGLQAAKELLAYENEQLSWKSIVTFLFEDHCLSDTDVVEAVWKYFEHGTANAKFHCVNLLMDCHTSRVNACLPVIGLDREPNQWDANIEVRESIKGLIVPAVGCIRADVALEHLVRAWQNNETDHIITYMKLVTMMAEQEKRQLTPKGIDLCIDKVKKVHFLCS